MENQINQSRLQSAEAPSQLTPRFADRGKELIARPDGGPPVVEEEQNRSRHAQDGIVSIEAASSKSPRSTQQLRDERPHEAARVLEVAGELPTDADRVHLNKSPADHTSSRAEHAGAIELAIRDEVDKANLTRAERETVMNRVHDNIAKSTRRDRVATPQPYEPRYEFHRVEANKDKELDR